MYQFHIGKTGSIKIFTVFIESVCPAPFCCYQHIYGKQRSTYRACARRIHNHVAYDSNTINCKSSVNIAEKVSVLLPGVLVANGSKPGKVSTFR
jgi:hypothetical protein